MDNDTLLDTIDRFLTDQPAYQPMIGPEMPMRRALAAQDVRRLTLFKWRYSLESAGFTTPQAANLLFLKWLRARDPQRIS